MKKCLSHCPQCNAGPNDILWSGIETDGRQSWQEGHCNTCSCNFRECHKYIGTEINDERG